MPVNVLMGPGQMAAALTVGNQTGRDISFQIRTFGWKQNSNGDDQLTATDELLASPPLATIKPGATQVVRLILRRQPQGAEGTYRIIFDQLSPPSEPGNVRIALRLSIPVFAKPAGKSDPNLRWKIVINGGQAWLVAVNDGNDHETVHDIKLHTADGRILKVEVKAPPHIVAGGTRRWRILTGGTLPRRGADIRLTASAEVGTIDQQVRVDVGP